MKGPLGNIMRQAQEMQEKLKSAQEDLAAMEVVGSAGGGLVEVVMTGRHDVRRVQIDDSLLGDDKAVLEDLIAAAMNDAARQAEAISEEKLQGANSGMGLPPGLSGLF